MNDEKIKTYFENMITWLDENFYGQSLYLILSEKIKMTDADIKECGIDSLKSFFDEKESISTKNALDDFNDMMKNEVEYIIDQMKTESVTGYYSVDLNDYNSAQGAQVSIPLLIDMLKENKLVDSVEIEDESLVIYSQAIDESETKQKEISQEELEVICAKHCLWLNDAGGERADFSNCKLKDLDFSSMNLCGAVFNNTHFEKCKFKDASLCDCCFNGARFIECDLTGAMAEESELKKVSFFNTNCTGAIFTHSNFTGSIFTNTNLQAVSFKNCCMQGAAFGKSSLEDTIKDGAICDENEWLNESINFCQSM